MARTRAHRRRTHAAWVLPVAGLVAITLGGRPATLDTAATPRSGQGRVVPYSAPAASAWSPVFETADAAGDVHAEPAAWVAAEGGTKVRAWDGPVRVRGDVPFVVSRVPVSDPVVFVTIDDGIVRSREAMREIERLGWPVWSFVLPGLLNRDVAWFERFGDPAGFGNHTQTHLKLEGRSAAVQKREICRGAKQVSRLVERDVTLFRPPYGAFDKTTQAMARACGMQHLVMWRVVVDGSRITTWGGPIRAGDIVLLHYRRDLAASLRALEDAFREAGLRPALLGPYLE